MVAADGKVNIDQAILVAPKVLDLDLHLIELTAFVKRAKILGVFRSDADPPGGFRKRSLPHRLARQPKLEEAELRCVYETVAGKSPMQLKFPFALWTAAMVRNLMARQFRVQLSYNSVCRLLGQMGWNVQ